MFCGEEKESVRFDVGERRPFRGREINTRQMRKSVDVTDLQHTKRVDKTCWLTAGTTRSGPEEIILSELLSGNSSKTGDIVTCFLESS